MELDNYAQASKTHEEEIVESLTTSDIKLLASKLKKMGLDQFESWREANKKEILDFVLSTPAKRNKKWQPSLHRLLLAYASILHCRQAFAILNFLSEYDYYLRPGSSYRDMTASVGRFFPMLIETGIPYWTEIFDEDICSPPFV